MKTAIMTTTAAALLAGAHAMPGMKALAHEVLRRQGPVAGGPLLGDLQTLPDSALTPAGKTIKGVLQGQARAQDPTTTLDEPVPALDDEACQAQPCCVWKHVADDMASQMGAGGQCNGLARQAIRMGFHDAAAWDTSVGDGGGADGSLVLTSECWDRPINKGIEGACDKAKEWYATYSEYGVGMADLIQMAANVATVVCPLGPRVRTFVGRPDSYDEAPDGLLPSETDDAPELISLFGNKTIGPAQLVALVGAHTTSRQQFVDVARAGAPQDSTPGIWDVNFYGETTAATPPDGVVRFHSDASLSVHPDTSGTWSIFTGSNGQAPWDEAYARAYVRMSLLGVAAINNLTECTSALPLPAAVPAASR